MDVDIVIIDWEYAEKCLADNVLLQSILEGSSENFERAAECALPTSTISGDYSWHTNAYALFRETLNHLNDSQRENAEPLKCLFDTAEEEYVNDLNLDFGPLDLDGCGVTHSIGPERVTNLKKVIDTVDLEVFNNACLNNVKIIDLDDYFVGAYQSDLQKFCDRMIDFLNQWKTVLAIASSSKRGVIFLIWA